MAPGRGLCPPLLLLLATGAQGLRTVREVEAAPRAARPRHVVLHPKGPPEKPVGRHIQMLLRDWPHGLTDRIWKFLRPLIALGQFYNATVHMVNGTDGGPQQWLSADHSADIAHSWGRYFDLKANRGNPWREPRNFEGCRTVRRMPRREGWLGIFANRTLCVNLEVGPLQWDQFPDEIKAMEPEVVVSAEVKDASKRFLTRYKVSPPYGSCHIRRCDLLLGNANCTDPQVIFEAVRDSKHLKNWLFFAYAEEGYVPALRKRLKPLGLHAVFEDEAVLNDAYPQDNYFTYLLGKHLNGGAERILETHECNRRPTPFILDNAEATSRSHGLYLAREADDDLGAEETGQQLGSDGAAYQFLASEEAAAAVCDGRSQGAKLLKDGNLWANASSQEATSHAR